jgi:hypothetical protein
MGQQVGPHRFARAGLFAGLPRRPRGITQAVHDRGIAALHPARENRGESQHRRAQHRGDRIDSPFGQGAQHQVPAHRMADHHVRSGRGRAPDLVKMRQVIHPDRKVRDIAHVAARFRRGRACLAAPVRRGYVPALRGPVIEGFQILFIKVPASRQEQDRTARRPGPRRQSIRRMGVPSAAVQVDSVAPAGISRPPVPCQTCLTIACDALFHARSRRLAWLPFGK